jgi:hemolysin activation/secretion protein
MLFAFAGGASAQLAAPRPEPLDIPAGPLSPPAEIEFRLSPPQPLAAPILRSVNVREFRFTGLHTIDPASLQPVVAGWTGRALGAEQLAEVAGAVTRELRSRGLLVAQAQIASIDVANGSVELAVIEGRIGQVVLEEGAGARLSPTTAARFLSSLSPGATIRRDNAEQSLLLLNDLPGVRIEAALEKGSQPDTADLRVKLLNEGRPVVGSVVLDNAGLRSTGETRADLNLRLRSPLGFGDLLALRYLHSSGGGQTLASITYGLPINGYGTRLGARFSEQKYRLRKEFTALDAHGEQQSTSLLVSHPLLRRSDQNLSLTGSWSGIDYVDRIGAVGLVSDSRHRIGALGVTYDLRDGWLGGGANLIQVQQLTGEAIQRDPLFQALDTGAGGLNVYGRYSLMRYRLQREQSLGGLTSLLLSVNGQIASRNLDAGVELPLGGPDAVRAYSVGELYADEGYVAKMELRRRFALTEHSTTALVFFIDQARVRVNRNALPGDPANKRGLGAYGFGLAHATRDDWRVQTWLAWRTSEGSTSGPDRSPRVWLTLAKGF